MASGLYMAADVSGSSVSITSSQQAEINKRTKRKKDSLIIIKVIL